MKKEDPFLRYSRQVFIEEIGVAGQRKIMASKVLVIGAGGLGSAIIPYLAAAGVGCIGIMDHDLLELHNLQRQIIHEEKNIGQSKAHSATLFVKSLNSGITVHTYPFALDQANMASIINKYDIILDGSDNFETRYLINDGCVQYQKPLVYGSIEGFQGQQTVFNYQGGKNLRDLFPQAEEPNYQPTCDSLGVLGPLAGIVGNMMALQALKIAAGLPVTINQLTIVDGYYWRFTTVNY
ncbi:HesA/MoeB/ThiF family protein [Sphingobacterium sp. 1.A.4]|uniref:HesA/MoeB/ThiF family protein n=1 Tax=Sphingobacterium sp. 1.A.4 TaxID=2044603 RepID=UPI000C0BE505|nr:HesA/MoeB/ThiF family protein [Sphingobacterium sp. 1.A.4]